MTANTPQRVAVERLNELLAKATPGPWVFRPSDNTCDGFQYRSNEIVGVVSDAGVYGKQPRPMSVADMQAASAAVNALPALLQQVADAMNAVNGLTEELESAESKLAAQAAEIDRLVSDVKDYRQGAEAEAREVDRRGETITQLREQLAKQAAEIESLRAKVWALERGHESAVETIQMGQNLLGALAAELRAAGCEVDPGASPVVTNPRAEAAERARGEAQEELATLQVIHNCLRRDHERSKAQAKAAREIAEQWNADARAEGFGGGSVKGREIIEAMEAAFLAANGGSDGR